MLRKLTSSELPLCFEGGNKFFEEGSLPGGFKPEVFSAKVGHLIDSGIGVVIGTFGDDGVIHGAIGGIHYADIYNGDTVATEMFWFMLPSYRGGMEAMRLLRAFELWAREKGCKRCGMVHLHRLQPAELSRLYERAGYSAIETAFTKELQPAG